MRKRFFVTGTDTDAGKTLIATGLLAAANARGLSTLALKPVAAGSTETPEGPRNDDALLLQAAMSESLPYEQINPVLLDPPIAPHIAAEQAGKRLTVAQLAGRCRGTLMTPADFTLVEGAGGWRVPLNNREMLSALAVDLQLPVILVVGMKLGCLNHALLTAEAIARDGLPLAGWVANTIDPNMSCFEENVATLKALLRAPCLGVVPCLDSPGAASAAKYLSIDPIAGA